MAILDAERLNRKHIYIAESSSVARWHLPHWHYCKSVLLDPQNKSAVALKKASTICITMTIQTAGFVC